MSPLLREGWVGAMRDEKAPRDGQQQEAFTPVKLGLLGEGKKLHHWPW